MCRWHHPYGRKQGGTKELSEKVKEESEKVGLKLNIQKTKIMASGPMANKWEKSWNSDRFYFHGLQKSLWTATEATKLKDFCFLEEKLLKT